MSVRFSFNRRTRLLAVWLIVALTAFPATLFAQDAPHAVTPAEAKAALWTDAPAALLSVEASAQMSGTAAATMAAAMAAPAYSPPPGATSYNYWTRIAFHSYRDGNAEIYTARPDGSDLKRWTVNRGPDLYPRLSPDSQSLVHVARDGEAWTLCLHRPDGVYYITDDREGNATDPAWSPDGLELVFASDRSGTWDLYTHDATGKITMRQLTYGGNDGAPAWSPDGKTIAYFRYDKTGVGTLRLIGADGSNDRAIIGYLPYAGHLAWSPDGERLAFDYDSDGDGWNEVVTLNPYRPYEKVTVDASREGVDLWMGAWSPDGKWLSVTVAAYTVQNNQLVLAGGQLAVTPTGMWQGEAMLLQPTGLDFNPDWRNADITPPVARMDSLPPYAPADGVTLGWSGHDPAGSGLKSVDIEFRRNGGAWEELASNLSETTVNVKGHPGQRYEYRVRARDYVGNVGAWTEPSAATTFYTTAVSGQTLDTRGQPVAGASITTQPGALGPVASDGQGRYRAHLAPADPTQVLARDAAYGVGAAATRKWGAEREATFALPPQVNLLRGGDFDAAIDGAWERGGNVLPERVAVDEGFGAGALALGQPALDVTETVDTGTTSTLTARDGAAYLRTVRRLPNDAGVEQLLRRKRGAAGWSAPVVIYSGTMGGPEMAVDSAGGLHLIWIASPPYNNVGPLMHCYIPPDGATCAPERVPGWTEWSGQTPALAVDALDGLHIAGGTQYIQRPKAGAWSPVETIGGATDIAVGPDGQPRIVWHEIPQYASKSITRYSERRADGTWSAAEVAASGGDQWSMPRVVVDAAGVVSVAWIDHSAPPKGGTYVTRREAAGLWTRSVRVTHSLELKAFGMGPGGLQVVALDGDTLREHTSDGETWRGARSWPLGGRWLGDVDLDAQGAVRFTAYDPPPTWPSNIYVTGPAVTAEAVASTISQAVTIPAGSHRPTLSFFLRSEPPSAVNGFGVSVVAGGQAQPLALHVGEAGLWRHAWADLSPWAGQTVTVRFELRQAAGDAVGRVLLDEVTAGEWLTPVVETVTVQGPQLVIEGANFIDATVTLGGALTIMEQSDGRIVAMRPQLKPGRYTVQVTNAGGQRGLTSLAVGREVFLPVLR